MIYVELIKQFGFTCSFDNGIATKKDIVDFLDIPISTLNSFLKKRQDDIHPIKLDHKTIKANGGKATRMNSYNLEDVSKIALGMDSVIGIELKKQAFGHLGTIVKPDTKGEIEWQQYSLKRLCKVVSCNWSDDAKQIQQAVIANVKNYISTESFG
ncbi:MAG: hypothetical protein QM487_13525 [Candidatus Marithrix sp.]